MLPVGFEPTISVGERLQTYVFDCAATGTGILEGLQMVIVCVCVFWTQINLIIKFVSHIPGRKNEEGRGGSVSVTSD
jgi:hypothetical protein